MKKTITILAEVPATQTGLFEARKSAQMIAKGVETMERKGGKFNVQAMNEFTMHLRGAAGVYEFDVVIDNHLITAEREAEVIELFKSSLPTTHTIVNIQ